MIYRLSSRNSIKRIAQKVQQHPIFEYSSIRLMPDFIAEIKRLPWENTHFTRTDTNSH